jgi:hypothetical protein
MTDLRTFLSEMALDPAKFAKFLREPEAAMRDQDLSDEDRDALLSGIPAMIWARLATYLAFPPPYYTPGTLYVTAPYPHFVTAPPPISGYTPPHFVTAALLYVTAPPPLYIPASPHFVTTPPPLVVPDTPGERPAPASPRTPRKKSR